MDIRAGISDITISIPRLYIPIANRYDPDKPTEFSLSRKTDPKKYLYGIGVAKMATPDVYQGTTVLAANAIDELIERNDITPKDINRIEIGTETSPDKSKSIVNYVTGALEKKYGKGAFKRCAPPEGKAACASTAFALENALDFIWSGRSNGNCRIICGTDIARYGLNTPGEPTQGAAAAAVLVEADPKLLEFDKIIGIYAEDEDSFHRPDFSPIAFVKGKKSEKIYLNAMKEAFNHYVEQAIDTGFIKLEPEEAITDYFDILSFHQPYPKMTQKGFASLLIHDYRNLSRWKPVVEEIGEEPKIEEFNDKEKYEAEDKKFLKKFMKTKVFQDSFEAKMSDGQEASIEGGNSYTASVWNHLVSLLVLKDKKGKNLAGKKGGIGFFGSGCVAIGQSYTIVPGFEKVVRSFNLMNKLENRTALTLDEYEALHEGKSLLGDREHILPPENEFVLTEIKNGYRHYDFVG